MTALEARLDRLAMEGETMTYGALARDLGLRIGALTAELERLMERDFAMGHPLRAALCAGRLSGGLPAPGFFAKAADLGYRMDDPAEFAAKQRAALHQRAISRA